MKVIGLMINKMVTVLKYGLMEHNMKVIISKVKNMDMESFNGLIKVIILANLISTILKDMEFIIGLMEENIVANGSIIKCKAKDYIPGLMVENMKVNMFLIKKKVMEYIIGLMEDNTMVNGKMENNMD